MFTSQIPLPESSNEAFRLADEGPNWLPRLAGHTGLKFSNGLEMAHNDASRATDSFNCPLACTFLGAPVQRWMTVSGLGWAKQGPPVTSGWNGVTLTRTHKPLRVNTPPRVEVEVVTDGSYGEKGLLAVLMASHRAWPAKGQPLRFDNGTAVSHSDESRALADFANKVDKGRINIGMKATFTGVNGTEVKGIQANRAKLYKLLQA